MDMLTASLNQMLPGMIKGLKKSGLLERWGTDHDPLRSHFNAARLLVLFLAIWELLVFNIFDVLLGSIANGIVQFQIPA